MLKYYFALTALLVGCGTSTGTGSGETTPDANTDDDAPLYGADGGADATTAKDTSLQDTLPGQDILDATSGTDAVSDTTPGTDAATVGDNGVVPPDGGVPPDGLSYDAGAPDGGPPSDTATSNPDGFDPGDAVSWPDSWDGPDGFGPPDGFGLPDGIVLPDGVLIPDGFGPPDGFGLPDGIVLPDGVVPWDGGLPDMAVYDSGISQYDVGGGDPCVYEKPAVDPGCTAMTDSGYLGSFANDPKAASDFAAVVQNCTLTQGCLATGNTCTQPDGPDVAQGKCIAGCIAAQSGNKVSERCGWCYGEYSGVCGFKNCLSQCAIAPDSTDCKTCLATNCDAKLEACKAGN